MVKTSPRSRYCYEHPRPAVTVDVVVVRPGNAGDVQVLLIRRGQPPFQGEWALPGGFVDEMEDLEDAARRELKEETGLSVADLRQVGAYGTPGRDPRGHTVSVAYVGRLRDEEAAPRAGDDAASAQFFPVTALPDLAFDHAVILCDALERLSAQ